MQGMVQMIKRERDAAVLREISMLILEAKLFALQNVLHDLKRENDVDRLRKFLVTGMQRVLPMGPILQVLFLHTAIRYGADVDRQSRGDRPAPLQIVTQHNYAFLARMLLRAGADANQTWVEEDDEAPKEEAAHKVTPLYSAARRDYTEVLQVLLEEGADPNKLTSAGQTAAAIAAKRGHLRALRALQQAGADLNIAAREVALQQKGHKKVTRK